VAITPIFVLLGLLAALWLANGAADRLRPRLWLPLRERLLSAFLLAVSLWVVFALLLQSLLLQRAAP
jgi:hypothetical protein